MGLVIMASSDEQWASPIDVERAIDVAEALRARNLPSNTTVAKLLDYEYRLGAQLDMLVDEPRQRKWLIDREAAIKEEKAARAAEAAKEEEEENGSND